MKKMLLLATAMVGLSVGAAHADSKFNGFYLGGGVNYGKLDSSGMSTKPFGGFVLGGYGQEYNNWYIGGEINGGWSDANLSNGNGASIKRGLTYGIAARAGYEVYPGIIGYGLLGFEGANAKITGTAKDGTVQDFGLRYGIGAEAFVKDNWTVRSELSWVDWRGVSQLDKGREFRATVGVGYHF